MSTLNDDKCERGDATPPALKEDKCERSDSSLPAFEEAESIGSDQDAVFGAITEGGPNYRNVHPPPPKKPKKKPQPHTNLIGCRV